MSEEDKASKTEDPTEKKLSDARQRGQVAKSQEFNHFMVLFGSLVFLMGFAPGVFKALGERGASLLQSLHQIPVDDEAVLARAFYEAIRAIVEPLIVPAFIMLALAVLAGIVQFGLLFAPEAIKPKLNKISPLQGLKRIFGTQGLVEFLKGIAKITTVTLVALAVILSEFSNLKHFIYLDPNQTLAELHFLIIMMFVGTLIVMAIIAFLDFIYQKWKFTEDMRMSKQEVKDEKKQTQGDPEVKKKLAEKRQEKVQQRMAQEVPNADAVVTNPHHYAVALQYREAEMDAPKVVAKGVDAIARQLREIAENNDVPVIEDPPLARALYDTVDIDEQIKPEHYKAVAEIISYVYRLKGQSAGAGA